MSDCDSDSDRLNRQAPHHGPGVPLTAGDSDGDLDAADASRLPFPVIGIGASAGGLMPLKDFLNAVPAKSGFAFVVVMHLDPNRDSALPEILGRGTPMIVAHAENGRRIEPDHVYVIPPNALLGIERGVIHLEQRVTRPAIPTPIDHLFRSLAAEQRERAVAVILSGSDHDGTSGLKEIKAAGGLVMVQDPATAEFSSMPRSAVATGLADYVLAPDRLAQALLGFVDKAGLSRARAERDAALGSLELRPFLDRLRARGYPDFRGYKQAMLRRRITRRMAIAQRTTSRAYDELLENAPAELTALGQDLLIGITEFFRDPDVWTALAADILPDLFRKHESEIRAWVPACSTGEEAYSLAMLLIEHAEATGSTAAMQIFATDVDTRALERARAGAYPASIALTVSRERLSRFFTRVGERYLVNRSVRELLVFAPQNLLADPPFSRLDLISCRNLLIYLAPAAQRQVLQNFHFGLNPGGYLLLGRSETLGERANLFNPVSSQCRVFQRSGPRESRTPAPLQRFAGQQPDESLRPNARSRGSAYGDLVRALLLDRFCPAAILVTGDHRVVYSHGPVDAYVSHVAGAPTDDLLRIARQGLRLKLRAVMREATRTGAPASVRATVKRGRRSKGVLIMAAPVASPDGTGELVLVTFAWSPDGSGDQAPPEPSGDAPAALEDELVATRHELHSSIADLEATNEALGVANEEATSMNEELQSANEELETAKEELQSMNEELTTVNSQLQEKVVELQETNDDLKNLLASTNIATLFLDREWRIKRYTAPIIDLFTLIPSDIGRPITDIASAFVDGDLLTDARGVLADLQPRDKELRSAAGEHYLRRLQPYRTADDHIEGVVATFVNITRLKAAEESERRLATVVRAANDAITVHSFQGDILAWNAGAERMYGYTDAEALGMNALAMLPEARRAEYEAKIERTRGGIIEPPFDTQKICKTGQTLIAQVTLSPLRDEQSVVYAIATTERDISPRVRAETELAERARRLELADRRKDEFLAMLAHELRNPLAAVRNAVQALDRPDLAQERQALLHEMIDRQSSHLARLVDDLLDVARFTRGEVRLERQRIDVDPPSTRQSMRSGLRWTASTSTWQSSCRRIPSSSRATPSACSR